ncbi:hypothetical protein EDB80DRAFT_683994 [Ilyonectria destructans]|nr:hypothetical protein EDB80DRAFT_683994 [Ilyonectria destructans]
MSSLPSPPLAALRFWIDVLHLVAMTCLLLSTKEEASNSPRLAKACCPKCEYYDNVLTELMLFSSSSRELCPPKQSADSGARLTNLTQQLNDVEGSSPIKDIVDVTAAHVSYYGIEAHISNLNLA